MTCRTCIIQRQLWNETNTKNHPFNNLELSAIAEFMSVQLPNCIGKFIKGVLSPGFVPLVIAVL